MDLSRISIVARERSPWEAIDLGIIMARKWYRPLVLGWMVPSLVVFIVFSAIFYDSLWIGITITWWLKPLWDRVPLYMASRALFGEEISLKNGLQALPQLVKKDWFAWLTWRRLSLTRAFDMPVTTLEGLSGKDRQQRLQALHIKSAGPATWLTIVCLHLEYALAFGGLGLLYLFIPQEIDFNIMEFFISEDTIAELMLNVAAYFAMVFVSAFYTMAGFALYISRRISLEAWDVEVRFRNLAERQSSMSAGPGVTKNSDVQGPG